MQIKLIHKLALVFVSVCLSWSLTSVSASAAGIAISTAVSTVAEVKLGEATVAAAGSALATGSIATASTAIGVAAGVLSGAATVVAIGTGTVVLANAVGSALADALLPSQEDFNLLVNMGILGIETVKVGSRLAWAYMRWQAKLRLEKNRRLEELPKVQPHLDKLRFIQEHLTSKLEMPSEPAKAEGEGKKQNPNKDGAKDDDDERKKKSKHFATCAFIKSSAHLSSTNDGRVFDLPGKIIALSKIPQATTKGVYQVNSKLIAANGFHAPGIGRGDFIMKLMSPPIVTAAHTGATEPMVYPPLEKGKLVRLPNVMLGKHGVGDLVIYIPNKMLTQRVSTRETIAAHADDAKVEKIVDGEKVRAADAAIFEGYQAVFEGGKLILQNPDSAGFLAGTAAVIGAAVPPLIIAGTAAGGLIYFFNWLNDTGSSSKQARIGQNGEYDCGHHVHTKCTPNCPFHPEAKKKRALEKQALKQQRALARQSKPAKPTHHAQKQNPQQPTATPTQQTNNAQPPLTEQTNPATSKLLEKEVKTKFGEVFAKLSYEIPDKSLFDKQGNKSLISNKDDLLLLTIEAIQNNAINKDALIIEHDFGKPIGHTADGKPLTALKVERCFDKFTGNFKIIAIYPDTPAIANTEAEPQQGPSKPPHPDNNQEQQHQPKDPNNPSDNESSGLAEGATALGAADKLKDKAAEGAEALVEGIKNAANTIQQFSSQVIEDGVKWAMRNTNKIDHIFKNAEHNLGPLVQKFLEQNATVEKAQEATIRAVLNAAQGKLPSEGTFDEIPIIVEGFIVHISGRVMDGVPKLGTFFIK